MKAIARILTLFVVMAIGINAYAQTTEEISLTVSSDGPTKDDALKNALRTAIEQAYGAFVSANTTILNDDLVKDEIVTISTGAIKTYSVVSEYEKKDGNGYGVTVNAIVSLPHLVKYAQNHGSECEFAGNTFGMQMKLWELQKENELIALENLISQIEAIVPSAIYYELKVGEPIIIDDEKWSSDEKLKSNYKFYGKLNKYEEVKRVVGDCRPSDFYKVNFRVIVHCHPKYSPQDVINAYLEQKWRYVDMDAPIHTILDDGMKAIALSKEDVEAANKRNQKLSKSDLTNKGYRFRNEQDTLTEWEKRLADVLRIKIFEGLCIEDNTGEISDPRLLQWTDNNWRGPAEIYPDDMIYYEGYFKVKNPNEKGLFSYLYNIDCRSYNSLNHFPLNDLSISNGPSYYQGENNKWEEMHGQDLEFSLDVLIPKDEINKYSNFKIVKK